MSTPTDYEPITPEETSALQSLRHKGYAVVILDPEELQGTNRRHVEDALVEQAWGIIDALKD